ncbi:hypothetical protein [Streptomyces sp. NPDC001530]|uniref:hypothetical protein n=1 Tax=Streptomyces sp. NPDC001530 TaxID=3364582 RepID=UPI0036A3CC16
MRLVIWYRGPQTVSADELLAKLPAGSRLVDQQMPNIFLVESDEDAAKRALASSDEWSVAPEQPARSLTR